MLMMHVCAHSFITTPRSTSTTDRLPRSRSVSPRPHARMATRPTVPADAATADMGQRKQRQRTTSGGEATGEVSGKASRVPNGTSSGGMAVNGSDEHENEGAGPAAEPLDSMAGFVPRSISDIVERGESAPTDVLADEQVTTTTTTSSHVSSHRRVAGRRRSSLSPPKAHEMEEAPAEWTDGAKSLSPPPVPYQVRRARLTMLFNSAAAITVIPTLRNAVVAAAAAIGGRDRAAAVSEGAEHGAGLARSDSALDMQAATRDLIGAMGIDPDWMLDCYTAIVDHNIELGKTVAGVTLQVRSSSSTSLHLGSHLAVLTYFATFRRPLLFRFPLVSS